MKGRFVRSVGAFAACFLLVSGAQAATWNEVAEAGELLSTANVSIGTGSLTLINGSLVDLGRGTDDVDLYKISIVDPNAFSVVTSATLSEDNDAQLFLFDTSGGLILANDDGGSDTLLPEFAAGELAGQPPGIYYLAFDLYDTDPIFTPGGEPERMVKRSQPLSNGTLLAVNHRR